MKIPILTVCALAATLALTAAPSRATTTYALTNGGAILTFDHLTPQTVTSVTPTPGVVGGYVLLAIDIRPTVQAAPANPGAGSLWAIGRSGTSFQLFVIDPATGTTTAIGVPYAAGIDSAPGVNTWGFDFNPTVDRIRLVNSAVPAGGLSNNYRLNPNVANGVVTAQDSTLSYAVGDPNAATPPQIDAVAYTTTTFGAATSLYGLDTNLDILAKAVDPNLGTYQTIGALGVALFGEPNGFDIYQSLALFSAPTLTGSSLYSVNLTTGAATLVGAFPVGTNLRGLAISISDPIPPPPVDAPPVLNVFGNEKRTTRVSPAIVRGIATDESGVVALSYRVTNRTTTFTGSPYATPFTMKVRRLAKGENRVVIRATDPTGHITKKVLKINYRR